MNLVCPKCLSEETVMVDVADGDTLHCNGCDEEYTVTAVLALVDSWAKVLPWLKAHPARREQPAAV